MTSPSTPAQEPQGEIRADTSRSASPAKSTCGRCLKPITMTSDGTWFDGNDYWCAGTGYLHDRLPEWVEENISALREERDKALNALREVRMYAIHGCGTKEKDIRGKQFGAIVDLAESVVGTENPEPAAPQEEKP